MSGIVRTPSFRYAEGGIMELMGGAEFKIYKHLGLGGQGQVYVAKELYSGVISAIKLMDPVLAATRPELRKDFEHEGRLLAQLGNCPKGRHPNIVELKTMGLTTDGIPVLVMEHLLGQTLQAVLDAQPDGKLPLDKVIEIGKKTATGLLHAHTLRVVHRDIKPDNLFIVSGVDGRWELKIIDFGGHRLLDEPIKGEQVGRFFGTPAFASIEQLLGRGREEADIFSLGVTLYRAASGKMPFRGIGSSYDDQLNRLGRMPDPIRMHGDFPWEFEDLLQRMMHPDPAMRPRNMKEILATLAMIHSKYYGRKTEQPMPSEERAIKYSEGMETLTHKSLERPVTQEHILAAASAHILDEARDVSTRDAPISPSVQAEIQRAQEEFEQQEIVRDTAVDPIRVDQLNDSSPHSASVTKEMHSEPPEAPDRFQVDASSRRPAPASDSSMVTSPVVAVHAAPNAPAPQPVPTAREPILSGKGGTQKKDISGPLPPPRPEWNELPAWAPRGKKRRTLPVGNSQLVNKSPEAWAPVAPAPQPKSATRPIQDLPPPSSSQRPAQAQQQVRVQQPLVQAQQVQAKRVNVMVRGPLTWAQEQQIRQLIRVRAFQEEQPETWLASVDRWMTLLALYFDGTFLKVHQFLPRPLQTLSRKLLGPYFLRSEKWRHFSILLAGVPFLLIAMGITIFFRSSPAPSPTIGLSPSVVSPASAVAPPPAPPPAAQSVTPTPSASALPVVDRQRNTPSGPL